MNHQSVNDWALVRSVLDAVDDGPRRVSLAREACVRTESVRSRARALYDRRSRVDVCGGVNAASRLGE
jgi:hypothetical protein